MKFALTRRHFLGATVAASLALGLPAFAQDKPTLKFSAVFSEQDIRAEMTKSFAEAIKDNFTLEPYYGGTLFKQGTELVALQRGNLADGQHRPAGHFQPDSGMVRADIGLSLPGCRPCHALSSTARPVRNSRKWPKTNSASTFSDRPISVRARLA